MNSGPTIPQPPNPAAAKQDCEKARITYASVAQASQWSDDLVGAAVRDRVHLDTGQGGITALSRRARSHP
jgi:hypothetical protein